MSYCKVQSCRFPNSHTTRGHLCGTCKHYGHGQVECGRADRIAELENKYGMDILPEPFHCTMTICGERRTHTSRAHHCTYYDCHGNHSISECPLIIGEMPTVYTVKCPLCRKLNSLSTSYERKASEDDCCICLANKSEVPFTSCIHNCICHNCLVRLDGKSLNSDYTHMQQPSAEMIEMVKSSFGARDGKIYGIFYAGMGCTWYIKREGRDSEPDSFCMHSDCWGQYGRESDDRAKLYRFIYGYQNISC